MAEWSKGICGCFGDCSICLLSFICPCIQFGRNAEAIGESWARSGTRRELTALALTICSVHGVVMNALLLKRDKNCLVLGHRLWLENEQSDLN